MTDVPAPIAMLARYRQLLVPLALLSMLAVLIVPVPPSMLDVLLVANISLTIIILLLTVSIDRPLEFSVFPAVLLGVTLLRLVLNVASTRLILTADAATPEQAAAVAGLVIEAFGQFVTGTSLIVGAIIFLILIVVQFVVITKGATRMSEVAARFALDALPGRQMAIDADLAAGTIDQFQAQGRRDQLMREADFYGAMDGASKFVRGDAIAGLIITAVNVVGGFAVGALEKGWGISESLRVFTRLTIGDGLVTQIPAFILATAAGLIVARTAAPQRLGEDIPLQLAARPMALWMLSAFLFVLALTPLPFWPFAGASVLLAGVAWSVHVARRAASDDVDGPVVPEATAAQDLLAVDPLEIEVGLGLVPLIDGERQQRLLDAIGDVRRSLAHELGIVVPPVRIGDDGRLAPDRYRIKLRGSPIAEAQLNDTEGIDALVGHLDQLIRQHADELLTREEVTRLLEQLKMIAPRLIQDTVPTLVTATDLQKILQNLLREDVPIRDLELILETVADASQRVDDPDVRTEFVRQALRRTISSRFANADESGRLHIRCVTVEPGLEALIDEHIDRGAAGTSISMPPELADWIGVAFDTAVQPLLDADARPIVLASPRVRAEVWKILEPRCANVIVLGYGELTADVDAVSVGLLQSPPSEHDAPERFRVSVTS
jgi:flagellar biosynthesis protein FlhA